MQYYDDNPEWHDAVFSHEPEVPGVMTIRSRPPSEYEQRCLFQADLNPDEWMILSTVPIVITTNPPISKVQLVCMKKGVNGEMHTISVDPPNIFDDSPKEILV